ncbi:FAD-dependent oxidoreductase [Pseudonocardia xishanensis]|uniref:NAD(P)/FAD-dependent oxidoreductase n=1 Tax=Pseudonocardia xishanensis TaxID=630995 RepID=A0ABP8RPN4_9PSEU
MKPSTDVLVVGAGPVGLLTALGLARAGLRVEIVERGSGIGDSPRAMTYLWFVLDGLAELGVLDDVERESLLSLDGLTLRVLRTGEVVEWGKVSLEEITGRPYNNVHLGQDRLGTIALRHLERHDGVTVHWDTRVTGLTQTDDRVRVATEGPDGSTELTAGWVVGADGAGSTVREAVGLGFDGMTWPERFVATNLRYPFDDHGFNDANMVVDPMYGAVVAKIDDRGLWRVTYAEDLDLPVESVLDRMPAVLRSVLPGSEDYELVHHSPYRMHQRAADTFRAGRVLLAGDAAHATNPTGGLGLISGLLDLYVLWPALAAVVRGEASDSVLDRWAADRRRTFLEIASPMASNFKQLVYHTDPARLEEALAGPRSVAGDPEKVKAAALGMAQLRSPQLVPEPA